jgi:hypothetical protein
LHSEAVCFADYENLQQSSLTIVTLDNQIRHYLMQAIWNRGEIRTMPNGSCGGGGSVISVQADLGAEKGFSSVVQRLGMHPPVWRRIRRAHAFSAVERDDKHDGGGMLARVA